MTPGQRAGLWIVLCLAGGAACAFLTLEGGYPYAVVFLVILVMLARRWKLLPESLAAFGLTFTLLAARFVIPNIAYFNARGDFASSILFSLVLAIGIGLMVVAVLLRAPGRWFRR